MQKKPFEQMAQIFAKENTSVIKSYSCYFENINKFKKKHTSNQYQRRQEHFEITLLVGCTMNKQHCFN